ncbi:4060_t:CDS:2, partial [Funneliformis caledonium]
IYNKPMVECELVYATLMATFYILSDNKTGVVVVPNVKPSEDDIVNQIFELQTGFSLLEDLGVTNLILDFHNNDSSPSFDNDMVVTELSRATFEAATSQSNEYVIPFDIPPSTDTKDLVRWAATIVFDYIYSTSFLDV